MLLSHHKAEWRNSAVAPEVIELNVSSIKNKAVIERLLANVDIPKVHQDAAWRYIHKHYKSLIKVAERGGWFVDGVGGFGCYKPDKPRTDQQGKVVKYEHPRKTETTLFLLNPGSFWTDIAILSNVSRQGDDFWQWVESNPSVPIVLTEGVKKAGALLSIRYAAIALPGVTMGFRTPKNEHGLITGKSFLIPELERFAVPGRTFYFAFDQDTKQKTIENVNKALLKTGELISQKGCTVKVIEWHPSKGKGVDDLIAQNGAEEFYRAYDAALTLDRWNAKNFSRLTYPANITINQRYLQNISVPEQAKLICIKSPKGTGKTQWLETQVEEAMRQGIPTLVISHRVQLAEALCSRFGIPYVSEIREHGRFLGYGLCIDSLHNKGQGRFEPEHWDECLVILDEVEQVIWHMLNSSTCQRERITILQNFKALIRNVLSSDSGKVLLADADLSNTAVDYIRNLAGFAVNPFVVVNEWQTNEAWDVYHYKKKDPSQLVAALFGEIGRGGKPFICCSAQKVKSTWGTANLEATLSARFPNKRILRIDSETVADPKHPAYGVINVLNKKLTGYDIVLASPSIETGVSIDIRGHFTSVWGIAQGVQAENSVRQGLARVREPVPRHIWIAPVGQRGCRIGNGATNVRSLLTSQHQLMKSNIRLLSIADLDIDGNFQKESLSTWAKRAVSINLGMMAYRDTIIDELEAEGHRIHEIDQVSGSDRVKKRLFFTKEEQYQLQCNAIAAKENPDDQTYEQLKDKKNKTLEERYIEKKGSLCRRYLTEDFNSELIKADDEGWHGQIQLHYYLTLGRQHLKARDTSKLEQYLKQGEGRLWKPDFNRSMLSSKVHLLEFLKIKEFMQIGQEFRASDELLQNLNDIVQNHLFRWGIKTILGVTLSTDKPPMENCQAILSVLGLRLKYIRRDGTGARERVYAYSPPQDNRDAVFARWLERDEQLAQEAQNLTKVTQTSTAQSTSAEVEKTDELPNFVTSTAGKKSSITLDEPTDQQTPKGIEIGARVWVWRFDEWIQAVVTKVRTEIENCWKVKAFDNHEMTVWNSEHIVPVQP
jgi:hypothetical protein